MATILFVCATVAAQGGVGLLLEQPIGRLGSISASGHAAIYLSRVCAASPTRLRRCAPGEDGVVISSFGRADPYYWTAIPLVPYLYAVEHVGEIPDRIDAATELRLRDTYRRKYLESVAPDGPHGATPLSQWGQLVGSAYDRRIYIFALPTSAAQDDRLIEKLNASPNQQAQYNFFFHNCANFAQSVLNFYYPHSVHRSFTADLGLLTPKQTAKSFVSYARHHERLQFSAFVIPQVPGKIHRSGKAYGVLEALLKKKQYVVPLAILEPYVAIAMAGTYLARGRFNPEWHAVVLNQSEDVAALMQDVPPAAGKAKPAGVETVSMRSVNPNRYRTCVSDHCGEPADAAE